MKKAFQIILGITITLGALFVLWYISKELINYLKNTDSKLVASIITASATILVGIGAVIISQNKMNKRKIEETHRESKIELYNRFNDFLFKLLSGVNNETTGKKVQEQEMIDFMVRFKRDLIFRASPEVIKAMLKYEISSTDDSLNVLSSMNDLLLAMRKDIGLPTSSLDEFELIQIFLKDKNEVKKLI